MRKQFVSFTLNKNQDKWVKYIADNYFDGNKSKTIRFCVKLFRIKIEELQKAGNDEAIAKLFGELMLDDRKEGMQ